MSNMLLPHGQGIPDPRGSCISCAPWLLPTITPLAAMTTRNYSLRFKYDQLPSDDADMDYSSEAEFTIGAASSPPGRAADYVDMDSEEFMNIPLKSA